MEKTKISVFTALGLASVLALAGCAGTDTTEDEMVDTNPPTSETTTPPTDDDMMGNVMEPAMVDADMLEGSQLMLVVGQSLVINNVEDVTEWSALIEGEEVVEFMQGTDDGTLVTNPGFVGLTAGIANVTLTNTTTGDEVSFVIQVVENDDMTGIPEETEETE